MSVSHNSKIALWTLVMSLACALSRAQQQPGASPQPNPTQSNHRESKASTASFGIGPDSTPLYPELRQASELSRVHKADEAIAGFQSSLEKAIAGKDLPAQALAHGGLGLVLMRKAEYPAARKEIEQALALLQTIENPVGIAQCHASLGAILYALGDSSAARDQYWQAIAGYETLGMLSEKAHMLRNIAMAGAPDGGKLQEQALAIARESGDKDVEAQILAGIGDGLFNRGQLELAQEKYNQAIAIFEQVDDQLQLAYVLTSQGRLLRAHGHLAQAIACFQRALDIQEKVGDRSGAIQSTNAMAVAYGRLDDQTMAGRLYEKALAMAKQTGSSRYINFELANLASVYISIGRDQEAVAMLEDVAPKDAEYRDLRYISLGEAYSHLGRFPEAIAACSKAIEWARSRQDWQGLTSGLAERSEYESNVGSQDQALADAQEALRVIEGVRAHVVPSDFMKRGFLETHKKTYAAYVRLLERSQQPEQALEVAEEARARAFLDLMATRDIEGPRGRQLASLRKVQDQLVAQGVDLSASGGISTRNVVTGGTSLPTDALWKEWIGADAELRSLVSAQPFSVAELHATARRLNSTVLSYWVSSDATYIWVIPADGPTQSAVVNVSEKRLEQLIRSLGPGGTPTKTEIVPGGSDPTAKSIRAPSGAVTTRGGAAVVLERAHSRSWRELYRLLIQPVEGWLPAKPGSLLTVEPHGPLLMLPFAALTDARGRYLLERFSLHYTPAVSIMQFTEKKEKETRQIPPHYLLIADPTVTPTTPSEGALPPLPGSRREISAVAQLMPAREVTILKGDLAAEDRVRQLAGQNTVIHFATHGIIRDDQPFDSFLALGKSGAEPQEDGRLTAQEIYGMDLHANLVFLSACRSGRGQVTGDGLIGLTRAFWYAGTPSVIASLWDVADEPTYELVAAFYRWRLQGRDKSQSLRLAQLHLLNELRSGRLVVHTPAGKATLPEDPIFWAGFALQGEP